MIIVTEIIHDYLNTLKILLQIFKKKFLSSRPLREKMQISLPELEMHILKLTQ